MGEQDDARREISAARERLSEIAIELSRRTTPDHIKGLAKDRVLQLKERAKEAAMNKTYELGEQMTNRPGGYRWLGAILGAGLGSMLAKQAYRTVQQRRMNTPDAPLLGRRIEEELNTGWQGDEASQGSGTAGVLQQTAHDRKDGVQQLAHQAQDRAGSALQGTKETAANVREKIPSTADIKNQAGAWYS